MMVGLPGSGKSTWAKKRNGIICSSDDIRKNYYGDESFQGDNKLVFQLLHEDIINNLKDGKDVIFDATNLNSKKRRSFLKSIENMKVEKTAVIMATSLEKCLEQNQKRSRNVPESVIYLMRESFSIPMIQEGFDQIKLVFNKDQDIKNIQFIRCYNQLWGSIKIINIM